MEKSTPKNRFIPLMYLYLLGLLGSTHILEIGVSHSSSKAARIGLAGLAVSSLVAVAASASCILKAFDNQCQILLTTRDKSVTDSVMGKYYFLFMFNNWING